MQRAVNKAVKMPAGYSVSWSGQFEYLERASARLKLVVPATLLIIFVLLYLTFQRFDEALLIIATLPFALVGGFWLLFLLGPQCFSGERRGLYCAGWSFRGIWRDHASLSQACLGCTFGIR